MPRLDFRPRPLKPADLACPSPPARVLERSTPPFPPPPLPPAVSVAKLPKAIGGDAVSVDVETGEEDETYVGTHTDGASDTQGCPRF